MTERQEEPRKPERVDTRLDGSGSSDQTLSESAPPPPETDFLEAEFGRYRDIRVMAMGGMGVVLRAVDPEIGRAVAIKILRSGLEQDPTRIKRFRNEARITGQLDHPNIVPIYDTGRMSDGSDYLIMKLVEGDSLADRIRKWKTSGEELHDGAQCLSVFLKVCDAVAFAHSRKIVHRDLKPANIMIGEYGEALVLDWGISKSLESTNEAEESTGSFRFRTSSVSAVEPVHTLDGALVGTPAYMSPEQALGEIEDIDEQSDIYALGAILYEVLTLERAIQATSRAEMMARIVNGTIVPPGERSDAVRVPRELEAVVLRAMAKDKQNRYATVQEMQSDIQAYRDGKMLSTVQYRWWQRAGKWIGRHRVPCVAALLILAVSGIFLVALDWLDQFLERQDSMDAVARGKAYVQRAGSIEDLVADRTVFDAVTGLERRENLAESERRSKAIRAYVKASRSVGWALRQHPEDSGTRKLLRRIVLGIARMALYGGDGLMARQAFVELESLGSSREEIEQYLVRVEERGRSLADWRKRRIEAILEDFRLGMSRLDRPRGAPLMDDYVAEVLGYRDVQTVDLFEVALDPLIRKALREGKKVTWTPEERDIAVFCCRLLGDLGLPGCVRVLSRWTGVVWGHELTVEAGRALCSTRSPSAEEPLNDLVGRLGPNTSTWKEVERYLDRIPHAAPTEKFLHPTEYYNRGIRARRKGRDREAIEHFSRAIQMGLKTPQVFLSRGNAHKNLKNYPHAFSDYTRALEIDPKDVGALKMRARCHALTGAHDRAFEDYERALSLDPKDSMIYLNRGGLHFDRKEYQKAFADFQKALELDPNSSASHFNIGHIFRHQGEYRKAIESYDRALQIDLRHAWAYVYRGVAFQQLGQIEKALESFSLGIRYDPNSKRAYQLRGATYLASQQWVRGVQDFSTVIRLDPGDKVAYFYRGQARVQIKKMAEAAEDFRTYLRLNPGTPQRAALERFIGQYGK